MLFPVSSSITAHVDLSAVLGQGAYGVVYGGYLSPSNLPIAVKVVRKHEQVVVLLNRLRKYQVEQFWTDLYKGLPPSSRTSGAALATGDDDETVPWRSRGQSPSTVSKGGREASTPSRPELSRDILTVLPPHPILPFPSPLSQHAALSSIWRDHGIVAREAKGRRQRGGQKHLAAFSERGMGLQTVAESEETAAEDCEEPLSKEDEEDRGEGGEQGAGFPAKDRLSSAEPPPAEQGGDERGVFGLSAGSVSGRERGADCPENTQQSADSTGQFVSPPSIFDSPHLLRVYGTYPCVDSQRLIIIMERLQGPSLFSYLVSNYKTVLPTEEEACELITSILKGLKEIHEKGVSSVLQRRGWM